MNRESFGENIEQNKEKDIREEDAKLMSRRDFLKTVAIAGGSLFLAKEVRGETRENRAVNTIANVEIFNSKYEKIDYTKENKEITPEIRSLILEISAFQKDLIEDSDFVSDDLNRPKFIEKSVAHEEITKRKIELWGKLKNYIPELEEYSEKNYCQFLVYDLPRFLAPYRVFVKSLFNPVMYLEENSFESAEALVGFHEIDRVESNNVDQWNKKIKQDIIYLKGDLKLDNRNVNAMNFASVAGQAYYQNVLIYEPILEKDFLNTKKTILDFFQSIEKKSTNNEDLYSVLEQAQDQRETAVALATLKATLIFKNLEVRIEDLKDNIIVHETRHVIDGQDETFKKRFKPKIYDRPTDYLAHMGNLGTHEEINGLLGELRYSKNKFFAMMNVLSGEGNKQDFFHDLAADYVLEKVINVILENPDYYNFKIDKQSHVSLGNQIIFQLPELINKQNLIEEISEKIMEAHLKSYEEDFSQKFLKMFNVKKDDKIKLPLKTIGKVASASILVGAGALLIREYSRRRNINEIESNIRISFADDQKQAQKIIDNLQLKIKSDRIDESKRQDAFRKLVKLSKTNANLEKTLERLRDLLDKK